MIDDNARYLNIYGSQLKVQYNSGTIFEEYVIDSQPFHFERWLSCTVCFTAIFLHLGLHHHHTHVLSILCFILAIFALIKLHTKVKKESLLIMKAVGLQITTIFASGRKSAKFIAWERIQGVVINEAITMHQVLFYLAILLKYGQGCEKTEVLPIFQVRISYLL
ncbi:phosphatidylinositol N-acetylglucosaminyltransferase subunit H-like [Daphnia carinata]|uniref:phosphatidylinositol N-acetylglucosaminyltransferase subunit H-like n=1 Tax=Daphnia carinata TaxID=120202 RepID=UPI002868AF1C|nr:phosphatidylinositol N-acetylglucosaminyltransferase subunit H-like [Daphnia carinata]